MPPRHSPWRTVLRDEARALWLPSHIARIAAPRSGRDVLDFVRRYVAGSRPVILQGLVDGWPALDRWRDDAYLLSAVGHRRVKVGVTPNGRADSVVHVGGVDVFATPWEEEMEFRELVDKVRVDCGTARGEDTGPVYYYSAQNDCLRESLPELLGDIEECLPMAEIAFGNAPDAVNLWLGGAASTSSLHKDHYENMFTVIRGTKHFTLLPPSDVVFLHERTFPVASFRPRSDAPADERDVLGQIGDFVVVRDGDGATVPWIPVDPDAPDCERFPDFRNATPIRCTVRPGETLYLPALWFHQVSQGPFTLAVNHWHDMDFSAKYVLWSSLRAVPEDNNDGDEDDRVP